MNVRRVIYIIRWIWPKPKTNFTLTDETLENVITAGNRTVKPPIT